ncbi:MAG: TIGR03663 family protein [Verrucomicrobiota bacterium]|nr:TIGR03663 family protein [Verrucomicrobiota bacterium]
MKPQPPVTKSRIGARTNSGRQGARAEFSGQPSPAAQRITLALESDWMFWVILALAAALRLLFLGIKPPHFDEGINGWFVDQMMKNGYYSYDPTNYHGPLHFYILFLFLNLLGRNLWALRLPVVLASITCVWLTMRYERVLPRLVARLAAITMAVSPAFVFYGRYSIHEVWLLLFSMLFILGLLGLWKYGTRAYLWGIGMGITGMILTKETYIIHLGCALIAIPLTFLSARLSPSEDTSPAPPTWNWLDLAAVIFVGVTAIVFFYSGTFLHMSGLKGLFVTFQTWFATGNTGAGHEKSWYYWLELLVRYEWPLLAGLILSSLCLLLRNLPLRFLAINGVGTVLAYSIIHYKTPWCIISLVWPLLFLFGAIVVLVPIRRLLFAYVAGSILLVVSLSSCISLNYFHCTDFADYQWEDDRSVVGNVSAFFASEPYVYVQTYNDIYRLTTPLLALAHANPAAYHLIGHFIRTSPYPFPWIFGDFTRIGYYEADNMPAMVDADFLVVQEDRIAEVEPKLKENYYTMPLTIRPYQDTSKLYLRAGVFGRFFPAKQPNFVGAAKR